MRKGLAWDIFRLEEGQWSGLTRNRPNFVSSSSDPELTNLDENALTESQCSRLADASMSGEDSESSDIKE